MGDGVGTIAGILYMEVVRMEWDYIRGSGAGVWGGGLFMGFYATCAMRSHLSCQPF